MNLTDRRTEALRLFEAGVAAADPYLAVAGALGAERPALIVAVGKAARRMAEAALAAIVLDIDPLAAYFSAADARAEGAANLSDT